MTNPPPSEPSVTPAAPSWMLTDHSASRLLDGLATGQIPGPGGCSAALAGALAASLIAMIARVDLDRWAEAPGVLAQADALRERLTSLATRDSHAHQHAARLLTQAATVAPDSDERAHQDRDRVLADALRDAAEVPLAIAETAADMAALGALTAHAGPSQLKADALVAVCLAEGAAQAATGLVTVNLAMAPDDPLIIRAHAAATAAQNSREQAHHHP